LKRQRYNHEINNIFFFGYVKRENAAHLTNAVHCLLPKHITWISMGFSLHMFTYATAGLRRIKTTFQTVVGSTVQTVHNCPPICYSTFKPWIALFIQVGWQKFLTYFSQIIPMESKLHHCHTFWHINNCVWHKVMKCKLL
jgi:hypothetical protein